METKEIEHYFADSTILQENPEEAEELVNLAGYQVTKAELLRTQESRLLQSGTAESSSTWHVYAVFRE